ncbi:MAG: thiamine pyrophosphate-dependent dehydrogenase E1 component subunit alpha [Verrucomicrobia bacterium]|nr:thiamine pyrophosphate-dependent dehydrogenase E1 component subunit alpha [Verrucomicrobiota bacterium]
MKTEMIKEIYYDMLRIRMIEEKIAELYPEQEMRCPVHLSIGQEAVAVGVCKALEQNDYVLSSHRSHAHYLAKGGDLKKMLCELYGRDAGCCAGKGGSMHLVDHNIGFYAVPIVGSTIPIGVGVALGFVMQGKSQVAVPFFGDAATEEGVFHESLNFAALKKLPVIFAYENNFYSVYSPLSVRQPENRNLIKIVNGHGIEGRRCDGNNVLDVYKETQDAVEKARQGGGPTLLEFTTYRWREHCGPNYDDHLGYRPENEFKKWKARDPIKRIARKIKEYKLEFNMEEAVGKIKVDIDDAFMFAKNAPYPDESSLYQHLYAT